MKKISIFTTITIALVLFISFCVAATAKSITTEEAKQEEAYYQELEKQYLTQIKEYLNEQGFFNSGITMTRIETEEGEREYNVLIHNSRITGLSEAEREDLQRGLEGIYSGMEECRFYHEFLVAEL